MFELVPYENSDRSEFSEEGLHGFLSDLNDEIIEEEKRREEPPDPESSSQMLMQIQQTLGQVVGQMKEVQSSLLFVNSRARFVRVVRVSSVCFSVLVSNTKR